LVQQGIEPNPGPGSGFEKEQEEFLMKNLIQPLNEIKTKVNKIDLQQDEILQRLNESEKEVQELRAENTALMRRVSQLERQGRRNNIVIFGVHDKEDARVAFEKITINLLKLSAVPQTEAIYRLGDPEKQKRPILVRLLSQSDKNMLMSKVTELKGTKISISDDLTPEDQATKKTILKAAKLAKEAGIACKVRRTGLLIGKHLIPVVDLTHPDWLERHSWLHIPGGGPPLSGPNQQPPASNGKRSYAQIVTPPGVEEVGGDGGNGDQGEADFRLPRSNSTSSTNSSAGRGGKRNSSRENNKKKK